jgi:hypothetical protein
MRQDIPRDGFASHAEGAFAANFGKRGGGNLCRRPDQKERSVRRLPFNREDVPPLRLLNGHKGKSRPDVPNSDGEESQ